MSSFLNFRYKNNTLNVQVNDLREFLDVAKLNSFIINKKYSESPVKITL